MESLKMLFISGLVLASIPQTNGLKEKGRFLSATVGENIMLSCFHEEHTTIGAKYYWYRQSLGMKPELISSFLNYEVKSELYGEYLSSNRFKLDNDEGKNDLSINDTIISDSAVYHCMSCYLHQCEFLETITVLVQSSKIEAKVLQPPLLDAAERRPVNLTCSVHFRGCDGQHRVHWLKQSEESAAGVLYSHGGGSSDQCERDSDAPTNSCVYSLPIHNLSSEQTGTYYCAVAACGQVLLGNGTRINIDAVDPAVMILSVALAFTSVLVVLLAFSLCRMKMKYERQNKEAVSEDSRPSSTGNAETQQENLHYAALNVKTTTRRPRNTAPSDCVYSAVR